MAGEILIKPDLQFVKRVIAAGGDTVKKCYQCDTCSVVCNLSPDEKPFPRKEMLQAQWGLKEVLSDPDIWLCHQCSDCTVYCPRGANPGEVLGVLRQMAIEKYATPPVLAKAVGDPKFLPLLIAFPMILLALAAKMFGYLGIPEGEIVYGKMFPTLLIDFIFTGAAAFAVAVLAKGALAFWQDINAPHPWRVKVEGNLAGNLIATLKDILFHNRFRLCETTYKRSTNHLFLVFGFIFLAMVTGLAFYHEWFDPHGQITKVYVTMKLLAIPGTAALLYGIWNLIKERQANAEKAGYGSYYDWFLIYVILVVGATGLLSWLFRLVGIGILAYPTYFLHLTAIFMLFFYAPYTKLAHIVYRTVAMLHARMSGRGF
ncbi:MAG: heterodisulfide reductase [Deltaproteobacteria bacterium CG07_land_8_20_14_0_80_60_11]|nr:MAG: heterodisulfide reductase [Deltaproteobacteria bacterium CG07_land_8_20_14_0_80_60_11]